VDTIFSDYQLTANRLARLLTLPAADHEAMLVRWIQDDQRATERRNFYRLSHNAIESLHRRERTLQDVRAMVDDWRLQALADASARERLNHNARATSQYLDQHGERELVVLDRKRLETCAERVRVTATPHLFALSGPTPTRLWLDCTEELDEPFLIAKCYVTIWIAERMQVPSAAVEIIHSARGRIVARDRLAPRFAETVVDVCAWVHRCWSAITRRPEVR
jgi:hypothetical protein